MTADPAATDVTEPDRVHLRTALDLARAAAAAGSAPFGAVLVDGRGRVLATGRNDAAVSGPTAHAETEAVRSVPVADRHRLTGATCYASGEPCPQCTGALVWAGVTRIVFAAATVDFAPLLAPGPSFAITCAELVALSDADVEVVGPALGPAGLAPFRGAGAADAGP
ncbi:nucleoside deaminase [Oerskovia flava]|uniref:nucleoside deaminase n=1 Tax=Oerskovia flava TaxID=2986422 RepID=UPI00223F79BB|nr:nucleoside deaminase [Oerskovia sp. JB1-3-2]